MKNGIFVLLNTNRADNVDDTRGALKATMFAALAWKYINNNRIKI